MQRIRIMLLLGMTRSNTILSCEETETFVGAERREDEDFDLGLGLVFPYNNLYPQPSLMNEFLELIAKFKRSLANSQGTYRAVYSFAI